MKPCFPFFLFYPAQHGKRRRKAATPGTHTLTRKGKEGGNLLIDKAVCRIQYDPSPYNLGLTALASPYDTF